MKRLLIVCFSMLLLINVGRCQAQFTESEANDSKATANIFALGTGGTITGNSTGASTTVAGTTSADYFRISLSGTTTPGIYRHWVVLTSAGAVGHVGTIRGLNQTAGVIGTTDATVQTSSTTTTPARFNQFYGFGDPSAELYYRVAGATATTADYVSTLETISVTPTSIGIYNAGNITISTVAQTPASGDTDFWVYDSSFNAIPGYGNDDESIAGGGTGATLQGLLTRTYAPGTYFLAMTNFNLANNQASPADDDFRSGAALDFPGFVANSSTTAGVVLNFTISDGTTSLPVLSTKAAAYDINWFSFTVVPEPSSAVILCLVGMSLLARRRR